MINILANETALDPLEQFFSTIIQLYYAYKTIVIIFFILQVIIFFNLLLAGTRFRKLRRQNEQILDNMNKIYFLLGKNVK